MRSLDECTIAKSLIDDRSVPRSRPASGFPVASPLCPFPVQIGGIAVATSVFEDYSELALVSLLNSYAMLVINRDNENAFTAFRTAW